MIMMLFYVLNWLVFVFMSLVNAFAISEVVLDLYMRYNAWNSLLFSMVAYITLVVSGAVTIATHTMLFDKIKIENVEESVEWV